MRSLLYALLSCCFLSAPARAALARHQSPEQLARIATVVIHGKVMAQEPGEDRAAHLRVLRTNVQVLESWKGAAPSVVTVQQIGSIQGRALVNIPGDAHFTPGEEVILFLKAGVGPQKGAFFLLGFAQGKYSVNHDGKGAHLEHDLTDLTLRGGTAGPVAPSTLEELRARVQLGGAR